MKCKNELIAQYKRTKETKINPYYGLEFPWEDSNYGGKNTTDEFITIEVLKEVGTVCANCKKEECTNP